MNVAWHCGSMNGYKHKYCRNTNSIGIEMCSRKDKNGKFYIKEKTVKYIIKWRYMPIKILYPISKSLFFQPY